MKALLVDDDLISRMALADMLGRFPELTVQEAHSGEQAWDLLQSGLQPAICFFDVRMPDIDGVTLLRRLRNLKRLEDVPVVFVTSASDKSTVMDSARLKVATYIVKPFDATQAAGRLKELMDESRPRIAESAAATMKRLGIDAKRYGIYHNALVDQLEGLRDSFVDPTLQRDVLALDRVKTGCLTLGLWHAARILEGIAASLAPGVTSQLRGELFDDLISHLQAHQESEMNQ